MLNGIKLLFALCLSVSALPAAAQYVSSGYSFLNAVRERDGNKVTEMLETPSGSVINFRDDKGDGGNDGGDSKPKEVQLGIEGDPSLIFESYAPMAEDSNIDVLRLTWKSKYACEKRSDGSDEPGEKPDPGRRKEQQEAAHSGRLKATGLQQRAAEYERGHREVDNQAGNVH